VEWSLCLEERRKSKEERRKKKEERIERIDNRGIIYKCFG
jgi:hypothetical protein